MGTLVGKTNTQNKNKNVKMFTLKTNVQIILAGNEQSILQGIRRWSQKFERGAEILNAVIFGNQASLTTIF